MSKKHNIKPANVNYFKLPRHFWRKVKKLFPKPPKQRGRGRPPADNRAILTGIWYVLWTGCQWKAIHKDWFGVCSSVLHDRFQTWQKQGLFDKILRIMVRFYGRKRRIQWRWQAIDSRNGAAPLGGQKTGKNPTDRAKSGSKIHILVDERGAPLSVVVTGANQHDKWSVQELILGIMVDRPTSQQHLCADKGYDFDDVHQVVLEAGYIAHIKHRRRRGEPEPELCPIPGELRYPARRWVVERTFNWLLKRRSIRTRWCKKADNWLALIKFACANIVFDMAFYG